MEGGGVLISPIGPRHARGQEQWLPAGLRPTAPGSLLTLANHVGAILIMRPSGASMWLRETSRRWLDSVSPCYE